MTFLMHIASVVLVFYFFFTACCNTLWMCVCVPPFPPSSLPVCVCFSLLHQSIFMFPLSFSSSSSLSSLPPSLDTISELDHGLSDISEDDDLVDDATASHSLWALPSNTLSLFSDQQSVDLAQIPPSPITSSQTCSSEVFRVEEGCGDETTATAASPNWWSRFSLRGVVKYVSFILCFLSIWGKNGNRCLPTKFLSGLTKKMSCFAPTVSKLTSKSAPKCIDTSRLRQIRNNLALKWTHFVAFITSYLPTKVHNLAPAVLRHPAQLNLPSISSLTCPQIVSSLPSYISSVPSLSSLSRSNLTPSIHRYLLNPSPLFLPCLLVVFLLVVMLTASQSLVLALILATPLGLTLCYLENVVSSQRKALLPTFITPETPHNQYEDQLCSLTPTHTPPRIRHLASATWMQEMCDPAA